MLAIADVLEEIGRVGKSEDIGSDEIHCSGIPQIMNVNAMWDL